jgi:hypothetical protein
METNQLSKQSTQLPQLSIRQILEDKPVKIGSIAQQDYSGIKEALIHVISGHNLSLATYMHLTPVQLSTIADFIISQYSDFSMDCVRLGMINGMAGKYGELKRFDGAVIYDWLTKFREEKRLYAMQFNEKKVVDTSDAVPMPKEVKAKLSEIVKKKQLTFGEDIDPEEEREFCFGTKEKKYKRNPPLKPTNLEVNAFDTFDFIHKKQSGRFDIEATSSTRNGVGQRMIEYNGITYSQGSWLNYFVFEINRSEAMIEAFEAYLNTLTT